MTEEAFKTDRPRRSTRAPARTNELTATYVKRKPTNGLEGGEDENTSTRKKPRIDQLQVLLQDPKSALTTIDIADVLNSNTWEALPVDVKLRLSALLPPTAFRLYEPSIELTHPSQLILSTSNINALDETNRFNRTDILDSSVFTDSHFLAAAHTFQDHLYTGWMTDAHSDRVSKFEKGVQDGTMHAPWKDEVWERDNGTVGVMLGSHDQNGPPGSQSDWATLAGDAAQLKLADLAKGKIIREGDVLSYRRNFSQLGIDIEKDVLIDSINTRTSAITALVQQGTLSMPDSLLARTPSGITPSTLSMTISSPSQLENGILDTDGRVEKAKRPNGNAWKYFTVWRWKEEEWESGFASEKGGRENHGTLFYLRGSFYHDR